MEALEKLSPSHRDVLVELDFRGHSVAEAADSLGVPVGMVKSRSYHAVRALREVFGGSQRELKAVAG
jgi:RNA polymerase sigma-70 factor (ECF subfamily)